MTIRFENNLAELNRLADEVHAFAGENHLSATAGHDILLALDELLTNVFTHGMAGCAEPVIEVDLALRDGEIAAEVRDNGPAFDPTAAASPDVDAPLEEREFGGLGIFLARSRVDRLDYRRDGGWNVVNLRRRC